MKHRHLVSACLALATCTSTAAAQTLAGGAAHTIVRKSDGTVWTFGSNDNGQLGDNTLTNRKSPIQVSGLSNIVAVAAGASHSVALTDDGAVYTWGDNFYGQLGDGTTTDRKLPVAVSISNVVAIAAGEYHTLALQSNGDLYTWGRNGKVNWAWAAPPTRRAPASRSPASPPSAPASRTRWR